MDSLRFEEHATALELDQVTVRNLELVEPLFSGQDERATLFHTLDACQTPMGKRLLRSTILRPLMDARRLKPDMRPWRRRMRTVEAGGDSTGVRRHSRPGAAAGPAIAGLRRSARSASAGGKPRPAAWAQDRRSQRCSRRCGGRRWRGLIGSKKLTGLIEKTMVAGAAADARRWWGDCGGRGCRTG